MKKFGNCFSAIYLCPIKAMLLRLKLKTMSHKQIENLLKHYYESASNLLKYTDKHWDAMYLDIQGYYGALNENESIDVDALNNQIKSVNMLIDAHKSLNYIYG